MQIIPLSQMENFQKVYAGGKLRIWAFDGAEGQDNDLCHMVADAMMFFSII